jgi:WD40 repeat protein
MKIQIKWEEDKQTPISACAIDPVHDQIIIGVQNIVYLLSITNKSEIAKCEKHTADVTGLSFRKDGLIFASGGKDSIVYLWSLNSLAKPISKIVLNDPIIQVNYNPCVMTVSYF